MAAILGIDVAKAYLDCFDSLSMRSKRFPNTPKGVQELVTFYESRNIKEAIIEATSEPYTVRHNFKKASE